MFDLSIKACEIMKALRNTIVPGSAKDRHLQHVGIPRTVISCKLHCFAELIPMVESEI